MGVYSFDEGALAGQLAGVGPAASYLFAYLEYLGAQCIVVEEHYVDRHYLDDFARYYSRSFSSPPAHCRRLHFFALPMAEVERLLEKSCEGSGPREEVEKQLHAPTGPHQVPPYLGFVVRRPLAGASIGRTVLQTYPADGGRRHYNVVRDYRVHLMGLALTVKGLAYQQQDRGAAVCASTALWSALQRVAKSAGHRTPTPSEITAAAGSPFPAAAGLDDAQMARAIATLGYTADAFVPADNIPLFRAKVISSIRSQLPVILLIRSPNGGHAVCVTGFSEPPAAVPVPTPVGAPIAMRAAAADVLYVHDDNLGSHAHYEFFERLSPDGKTATLMLRRGRAAHPPVSWWTIDECTVLFALIPKPQKVRLSFDSLFTVLVEIRAMIQLVLGAMSLSYAAKFCAGSDYKRQIVDWGFPARELRDFYSRATLPRHVGVISVYDAGGDLLVDVLVDASEVERLYRYPTVLGFVAKRIPQNSIEGALLQKLAQKLDHLYATTGPSAAAPSPVPVLFAP